MREHYAIPPGIAGYYPDLPGIDFYTTDPPLMPVCACGKKNRPVTRVVDEDGSIVYLCRVCLRRDGGIE